MLNIELHPRAFKDDAYGAFAQVTRALSSPRRLELIDLLIQGPRPVDALAKGIGQGVANTSQHLQVLKAAHVVLTRRLGTTIEYRLAPGVADSFVALRRLACRRNPALAQLTATFFDDAAAQVDALTVARHLSDATAVLLDLRPADEFAHAHMAGAHNIPLEELATRMDELPDDKLVITTCRGPFCVFAAQAVAMLQDSGRAAARFEDGVAEWQADGGLLETGSTP